MDPQETWNELLRCYKDQQREEAAEAADSLLSWLDRHGFPPLTTNAIPAGDALHAVIARTVCLYVCGSSPT